MSSPEGLWAQSGLEMTDGRGGARGARAGGCGSLVGLSPGSTGHGGVLASWYRRVTPRRAIAMGRGCGGGVAVVGEMRVCHDGDWVFGRVGLRSTLLPQAVAEVGQVSVEVVYEDRAVRLDRYVDRLGRVYPRLGHRRRQFDVNCHAGERRRHH